MKKRNEGTFNFVLNLFFSRFFSACTFMIVHIKYKYGEKRAKSGADVEISLSVFLRSG